MSRAVLEQHDDADEEAEYRACGYPYFRNLCENENQNDPARDICKNINLLITQQPLIIIL